MDKLCEVVFARAAQKLLCVLMSCETAGREVAEGTTAGHGLVVVIILWI